MNVKKVLPLVAAVILGLIAAKMVVSVAKNKGVSFMPPSLPKVVVAKQGLQAGQELTMDDLVVGQLAAESTPGTTFHDPAELVGRVAMTPIVQGQAILESLLAPRGSASGIAVLIPPGMRAETVEINEITGVAGFLSQNAKVDILQTLRDDVTGEQETRTIGQNITVTAVGQRHNAADDAAQQVRSVTLLVTPHQAEVIELASMSGRPRLVLRNSKDHSIADSNGATLAELRGKGHGANGGFANMFDALFTPNQPSTRPSTAGGDPFAGPTTQPTYNVRVFVAGESSVVRLNQPALQPADAASDLHEIGK